MPIRRIVVRNSDAGAITAFVTINNNLYGLTAGHVLTGKNNELNNKAIIIALDEVIQSWKDIGKPIAVHISFGDNVAPNNYGVLDAGIFHIDSEFRYSIMNRLRPIVIHPYINSGQYNSLKGLRVYSHSSMYERNIEATISDVFGQVGSHSYDLIIDSDYDQLLTTNGDSGILWTSNEGWAIGMHTNGLSHTISCSTLINRVCRSFLIEKMFWCT